MKQFENKNNAAKEPYPLRQKLHQQ